MWSDGILPQPEKYSCFSLDVFGTSLFFQKRLSDVPAADDVKKAKVDEPAAQDEGKSTEGEKVEEPKKDEAVITSGEEDLKNEKEVSAATVVPVEVGDRCSCPSYVWGLRGSNLIFFSFPLPFYLPGSKNWSLQGDYGRHPWKDLRRFVRRKCNKFFVLIV